ncbi:MAG: hypothetical protein EZS28_032615, partial [Streblomastix strix]
MRIFFLLKYWKQQQKGQQHPLCQQLIDDGTVTKLIKLYKDKKLEDHQYQISKSIAYVLKASPLNSETIEIVDVFKEQKEIKKLSLLAENSDNHDAILSNDFEKQLFEKEWKSLDDLKLIIPLLKFGSYKNKKKIVLSVKQYVEKLTNDQFVKEITDEYSWIDKKDQIYPRAKKAFALVRKGEGMIEEEGGYEEIDAIQMFSNKRP